MQHTSAMGTPNSESSLFDTSLLAFSLPPSNEVPALSAPTPSYSPSSSAPTSARSWLPGLLSGDAIPSEALTERREEDLDGATVEEPFLWKKKLFTKADSIELEETAETGDGTGIAQYRRQCENHGILPSLAVLSSLQRTHIEFSHYLLGEHGGFALASALRVNSQLTTLKLRFAALGNAAAIAVAQALQRNQNGRIKTLDLEGNGLGPEVGPALAELLTSNSTLKVLSLKNNPLRNLGCQKLFKALTQGNQTLIELDLEGTSLGDPAGPAIADCLKQNTSLKKLNLASNLLTIAWSLVADGLAQNGSLQVLDVSSGILLGDSGAAFCAALGGNTGLRTLDLTDCRFDEGSLGALASAMTQCRTLETLVMDGAAAKGLVQAFAANKSSCKIAFRKSAHGRAGDEEYALDFDGEVDASFEVDSSRKQSRISRYPSQINVDGPVQLPETEAAHLQAELIAAVQSFANTSEQPGKDAISSESADQKPTASGSEKAAKQDTGEALPKALQDRGIGSDVGTSPTNGADRAGMRKPGLPGKAVGDGTDAGKHVSRVTDLEKRLSDRLNPGKPPLNGTDAKKPASEGTEAGRPPSDGADATKSPSDGTDAGQVPADGVEGRKSALSELGVILQGTRLQELREEHTRAQKRARDNPKDLEALQLAAEAASNLSLHNEAALNYLRACSFSLDAAARRGFQSVMELLLLERDRYAPPKRTLYLKVKNLESGPLLARASSTFSLIPELEAVLDNLHDLLARGGDPEQAKARLRLVVRDSEDELREVFGFYAAGGTPEPSGAPDRLALRLFWRLARDCKLLARPLPLCENNRVAAHCQPEGVQEAAALDPHNGAADFTSLSFPSFVETMCRLSWVLHPGFRTLPEKFEQCVRQQVRPNARADSRDALQKQVSIAAGGHYADKHRGRLLKIFRHFCTDYAEAMAEAHVAAQEGDSTTVRSSVERTKALHGTPVFDREKESSASAGSGQHSGDASGRSRFEREAKQAAAASETLNPGHGSPRKGAGSKSLEGAVEPRSPGLDGTGAKAGGKKGLAPTAASVTSLGGMEEGPGYMTFNDLMRLADKMGLYSPQLNLSKVKSIVERLICFPELMPQQHMHNLRSRIILEEFVEILARFAAATYSGPDTAAARLQKDTEGGWKMLEEFLEERIYPMAKKILPGRL
ncbi:hypothetical protein KFL_000020340 [Klebsormidium nitens]|uniref:Uncharacterized protein n=1 Tax=Klebsormidium nitens TaxID=105231 RepID=A0A1Y1HJE9_KLENI|nr:hypothetical protein KFL_000020340 [Klebsormidium nitens]|eukprot:GAQ77672.1 hypothetical protein KFL_000020340 [Klebsormidium nitens]